MEAQQLEVVFNKTDADGNRLELVGGELFLTLASERKTRNIGKLVRHKDGGLIYLKNESPQNVFRKNMSWGLHWDIIQNVDYVAVICERTIYKLTAKMVREVGSFLWFKTQGFERQIFVPLNEWHTQDR